MIARHLLSAAPGSTVIVAFSGTTHERSAKHEVGGESCLARLLVFRVHVLAGIGQRLDRRVEIDAVPARDLVGRDHGGGPGLHGAEGTALDAGTCSSPTGSQVIPR